MKYWKIIVVFLAFNMYGVVLYAQDGLTDTDKQQIRLRVSQKIEEFQNSLSKIVDNSLRSDIRKEEVANLLNLFIGKGEAYDWVNVELDQRMHNTGVKMQTSSAITGQIKIQKLKSYIYKLYNPETGRSLIPYEGISIEKADVVRIDNVTKVADHYECDACMDMKFVGFRDGRATCFEATRIRMKIYLDEKENVSEVELPDGNKIFDVKLGDIYVLELKNN